MKNKILVYSSLFPSRFQPVTGLFVAELVRALAAERPVSVIKPVPLLKNTRRNLAEPRLQRFDGRVNVHLPLFFNFPRIFKSTDGRLMAHSTQGVFELAAGRGTALVHAHFAYPDGAAARLLSRRLGLPLVVTVHGSDVNILAQDPKRIGVISKTLVQSEAVICVSNALAEKVLELGVAKDRIHHIPNGVDTDKFKKTDKKEARKALGLDHLDKVILTVGNLIPIKAYDRLIRALPLIDTRISLVMVGQGHDRQVLENLAKDIGVSERVFFIGMVPHDRLFQYYSAADFFVISSHSEGWPTVILEAFACGLPVLANRVGGIPEVVSSHDLGITMENNDPVTIAETITSAYRRNWNASILIERARMNSWQEIARQYLEIFDSIVPEKKE